LFDAISILNTDECSRVHRTIHDLRREWIMRGNPEHPFYTVGAASYIDATSPPAPSNAPPRYSAVLAETNPMLREHFSWLYARVMYALSVYLQAEVRTADELALPGFHIWCGREVPTTSLSIHFDLQYMSIPWPHVARADRGRPLSFTLPIALPREGGGLNSWDLSYEAHMAQVRAAGTALSMEETTRSRTKTFHPYTEGVLTLHSGHTLHQIAAVDRVYPEDERITLQGHGLCCDGVWTIYW
jgi:hypothetical protein